MTRRRLAGAAAAAVLLAGALWLARPELIELVESLGAHVPFGTRSSASADAPSGDAQVAAGEYLARAGNCVACHTRTGGAEYAGGRPVATPFGDVYSTNLTPDDATGIGSWTADDFWRAMRYGKSKSGRRLYPAFPYPSYTLIGRADSDAILAYLKSLEPVTSPRIEPQLRFPYDTTLALLVWRALYFDPSPFEPRTDRSPEWNRGAYLTEGLGHCGACHTPRGLLGGSRADARFAGGDVPMLGWDAPPLRPDGARTDTELDDVAALLKTGVSSRRAVSGPMAEVVYHSLQHLRDDDIAAIVRYISSLPATEPAAPPRRAPVSERRTQNLFAAGASIYAEHCADCHGRRGQGEPFVYPALAGNREVTSPSPANALRTLLFGGFPPTTAGNPRPFGMPPYSHRLSDYEIAAVLTYIRGAWGNAAPPVSQTDVARR